MNRNEQNQTVKKEKLLQKNKLNRGEYRVSDMLTT